MRGADTQPIRSANGSQMAGNPGNQLIRPRGSNAVLKPFLPHNDLKRRLSQASSRFRVIFLLIPPHLRLFWKVIYMIFSVPIPCVIRAEMARNRHARRWRSLKFFCQTNMTLVQRRDIIYRHLHGAFRQNFRLIMCGDPATNAAYLCASLATTYLPLSIMAVSRP